MLVEVSESQMISTFTDDTAVLSEYVFPPRASEKYDKKVNKIMQWCISVDLKSTKTIRIM